MSKRVCGHKRQRRMFLAAVATASVLLAVGAPVATASPGTGGGSTGPNHHIHTGGAVTPTGKLTSAVTPPRGDIASSGSPTPTVHLPTAAVAASPTPTVHLPTAAVTASPTPTVHVPTAAATPASPGPGINFGPYLNFGVAGTGNTNFGQNFFLDVNLYAIGNNNTGVANNNNFYGINVVFAGSGNISSGSSLSGGIGIINPVSIEIFGTNFAVLGSNTENAGNNNNSSVGIILFGSNFAVVGDGSTNSGDNTSGGMNFAIVGANSNNEGNNTGGGINIAIDPTAANPGNCTKALCINLFGLQLL